MSRVLITGGAGALGASVARLLLADPAYDVRISDARPAPQWMREGCEIHSGDLRSATQATAATKGCSHVIHLACFSNARRVAPTDPSTPPGAAPAATGNGASAPSSNGAGADAVAEAADEEAGPDDGAGTPHTLLEHEAALHGAVIRAALGRGVERFVYVSSPLVFERAELFPTPEQHLDECIAPRSARGFARLSGERLCAAAHREHGLQYAICRPFGAYGGQASSAGASSPGGAQPLATEALDLDGLIERAGRGERRLAILGSAERTLTPTHVDDLAGGILAALGSPAAAGEDFNLGAAHELSLAEIAQIAWQAGAAGAGSARAGELSLESLPAREPEVPRSAPSVVKARELLGWEAQIDALAGIAAAAAAAHERAAERAAEQAASATGLE